MSPGQYRSLFRESAGRHPGGNDGGKPGTVLTQIRHNERSSNKIGQNRYIIVNRGVSIPLQIEPILLIHEYNSD